MILKNPNKEEILKQVAKLHKESITTGFLSSLGEDFLYCLYKAISLSDKAVLLVDVEKGRVRGFVAGSLDFADIKMQLLKSCKATLLKVLLKLVINPKRFFRFLETYHYTNTKKDLTLPAAELLSIAVHPLYRKQKIATNLYKALVEYMKKNRVNKFKIVVGENLKGAQKFYEKMGAKKVKDFELHKGQKSWIYIHCLESK